MQYLIKAGVLYDETGRQMLAKTEATIGSPVRKIISHTGEAAMQTDIRFLDPASPQKGDVRNKEYLLEDAAGRVIASGRPGYAKEDDPDAAGWPINRLPKADHADLLLDGTPYLLSAHDGRNYSLYDGTGFEVLTLRQAGAVKGWQLSCADAPCFSPEILCGIYTFCKYLKEENEFPIV